MGTLATAIALPVYPILLFAVVAEYAAFAVEHRGRRFHAWLHGPLNLLAELFACSCRQLEALLSTILFTFGLGLWRVPTPTFEPLAGCGIPWLMMLFGGCHLAAVVWGGRNARILTCTGTFFAYLFLNGMIMLTGVSPLAGLVFGPLFVFSIAALASLGNHGPKQSR